MGTSSLNKTIQTLGIELANNTSKKAVIATQNEEDAINAMSSSASSTNAVATHNDIDGTNADITPNSVTVSSVTDSTSGSTGSINTLGGLGVTKAAYVGTSLAIGTNVTLAKEVDHTVTVTTTTTAATAGGALDLVAGQGATSGTGGEASIKSGAGGTSGAGGVVNVISGAGGATSGASGAVNVKTGSATVGSSGTVTISSGNTASGVAGDVTITTGTHTSTTVVPCITLTKATVRKPSTKSIATGGTLTGPELVGGYIEVTGGTGNVTLPDTSAITTAIGSTPAGTWFDFHVNATGMTATNVATLVAGANMTIQKQTSSGDSAVGQLMTITQTAGTEVGVFRITFITATTTSLHRIA